MVRYVTSTFLWIIILVNQEASVMFNLKTLEMQKMLYIMNLTQGCMGENLIFNMLKEIEKHLVKWELENPLVLIQIMAGLEDVGEVDIQEVAAGQGHLDVDADTLLDLVLEAHEGGEVFLEVQ